MMKLQRLGISFNMDVEVILSTLKMSWLISAVRMTKAVL